MADFCIITAGWRWLDDRWLDGRWQMVDGLIVDGCGRLLNGRDNYIRWLDGGR
jgi:hypothetical protein